MNKLVRSIAIAISLFPLIPVWAQQCYEFSYYTMSNWHLTREESCKAAIPLVTGNSANSDEIRTTYTFKQVVANGYVHPSVGGVPKHACELYRTVGVLAGYPEARFWYYTTSMVYFPDNKREIANSACYSVKVIDRRGAPPKCEAGVGNPIYPLRGTKREEVDLRTAIGKLNLKLTYDTADAAPLIGGATRPPAAKPLVLGPLWSSSLHRKIFVDVPGKGALVARGDGRTVNFGALSGEVFAPDPDSNDRLFGVSDGYRYIDASAQSQEIYDAEGRLTSIHWLTGESVALTYSTATSTVAPAAGYLVQAQDGRGRAVGFSYQLPGGADPATGGMLSSISDAQGQTVSLGYDSAGNLDVLTWADSKSRHFHYENAGLPWALTGVTDELGVRYATFGYDSAGRAISTEHAGGVGLFSASWASLPETVVTEFLDPEAQILYRYYDWVAPAGTAVATPNGGNQALGATSINGKTYLTSQSQPAGSGCAASTSEMDYDANGNLTRRDDFNGTRACFANDMARNLQTAKVEGLANSASCAAVTPNGASLPTGSRKSSTEWHPDWSLQTRVAEPGKRTTYVYNGQPDPFNGNAIASCAPGGAVLPDGKPIAVLCKQVEQATTDVDGGQGFSAALQAGVAARSRQWTYNATGQVLSEADALNRTTTYAYFTNTNADHTLGDPQSVTNAAGQITNYTKYSANGQLLEMVDANGVSTVHSYDARQRLLATSVAGQTTTFSYDFIGQPRRTTQADGSWIEYEYDAAHRMNAVKDDQGNRIDYTLDNEGKMTAQNVKDPGGSIKRSLARTIDALGRVERITGRQ